MKNKQRIEIRFTRNSFIFGFGWECELYNKHFALIIGCFIIRFNPATQSDTGE